MDDSGIRRRVDDLGRVVIPADYRHRLGIEVGDEVTFSMDGDRLLLEREQVRCVLCDSLEDLSLFRERPVCKSCMTALAVLAPQAPAAADAGDRLLVLQEVDRDDRPEAERVQPVSTTAW